MHPQASPEGSLTLSRLVVTDQALDATLQHVADLATREVIGCDMAGITLLREGEPVTAVFTDPTAPQIDTAQYETGSGPCLDAFHEGRVFRIDDTSTDARWPEFAAAAGGAGVRSTLSLPLVVGETGLGALNLYSQDVDSFIDDDTARVFAAQASVVLANSQAYWAAQELAAQLEEALTSRATIEQAKGVLMATHRLGADEAFAWLRRESQNTNRKLRVVARDIVESVRENPQDGERSRSQG
jgi:GAF domain-containing protein